MSPGATNESPSSESPSPSDEDNVCFPSSARVTVQDGSVKRMDQLAIGEEVQVGPQLFSAVFMFTHKSQNVDYRFLEISVDTGSKLLLTDGHFLYLNGEMAMAKTTQVGDTVSLSDGGKGSVVAVSYRNARGLYNPQTMHGDILVDGVLASTYTKTVSPHIAHGLLAPLRWAFRAAGLDASPIVLQRRS